MDQFLFDFSKDLSNIYNHKVESFNVDVDVEDKFLKAKQYKQDEKVRIFDRKLGIAEY